MTKILLVEDDKSLREIYGVRLLAEGYDIISAGDGEEALAMAIKDRPSLIISDVMMPKISGFDMLDILRSTTETRGIKVIMMTALSSEDQRKRGEQLGADRYLVKSQVGIEDVVRAVHEVLADAPTTTAPIGQPVGAPQGIAAPRPINSPAPAPSTTPAAPAAPTPQNPTPAPAAPAAPIAPPVPASTDPTASSLPEPTAPFSTPRPANLASRVIEPISKPESDTKPPVADLMDMELNAQSVDAPVAAPVQSPAAPTTTTAQAPSAPEESPLAPPPFPPQPTTSASQFEVAPPAAGNDQP